MDRASRLSHWPLKQIEMNRGAFYNDEIPLVILYSKSVIPVRDVFMSNNWRAPSCYSHAQARPQDEGEKGLSRDFEERRRRGRKGSKPLQDTYAMDLCKLADQDTLVSYSPCPGEQTSEQCSFERGRIREIVDETWSTCEN